MSKEYKYERVLFEPSRLNNGEFVPRIGIVSNNEDSNEDSREFRGEDMIRVLDFDNMDPPPSDAIFGHSEFELDDDDNVHDDLPPKFPKRYCILRGSYVFYFSMDDIAADGSQGRYHHNQNSGMKFKGTPLGIIPLDRTVVEFPPGGRRVFREHAQTDARNGYEMMIRHMGRADNRTTKRRAPAYIVAETSGQRELWKKAIVSRADVHKKDTKLRPKGAANITDINNENSGRKYKGRGSMLRSDALGAERRVGGNISVLAGVLDKEEQKNIDDALEQFGNSAFFEESDWVNQFFEQNDEFDSLETSRKLEKWQTSIKKGLRGAVLEQYEYFVEASKGMTIMGREIATLKDLVGKQVETVESMKNVTFELGPIVQNQHSDHGENNFAFPDDEDDIFSSDGEGENQITSKDSWDRFARSSQRKPGKKASTSAIEIPEWLMDDVVEEISAFVKQFRYLDATDLLLKAKVEVNEIMSQHEKLTEKTLPKKKLAALQRILRSIDNLTTRICQLLSEGLRRKNDALRQIQKKERNDPLLVNAPIVSPIALKDDAPSLHLLIKLGRPLDAATAFTTRRSLLLSECLHERPICQSTHSVDVVLYAAQMSHSFFVSLAMSVEEFLDLFAESEKHNISDDNSEASSIYTESLKSVPSNALAATCLWCDSEIAKFAAAFGNKILGHINLSPRTGSANAISDKISQFEVVNDLTHDKKQLQVAVEMGEYEIAEKLRKKIALRQQETNGKTNSVPKSAEKDRRVAIEIAAKCVDQAFEFANECLNSIGLPFAPRLAEYLRPRLKGTDVEIAVELNEKWGEITYAWKELENAHVFNT